MYRLHKHIAVTLSLVAAIALNIAFAQPDFSSTPGPVNPKDAHIYARGVDSIVELQNGMLTRNPKAWGDGKTNSVTRYQFYKFYYPSIDATGKTVYLSALAAFPYNLTVEDTKPKNVVIGCHVTITNNTSCATEYLDNGELTSDIFMLVKHASALGDEENLYNRNLVIIPDYLGYGYTVSKAHPYLYQELTARNVVDATRYGIALFLDDEYEADGVTKKRTFETSNWKSISVGYSQGGSVALAVHKFIELNDLSSELHFLGSVCGDGPYDPIATMRWYAKQGKLYMPVVLPLILKGMIDANPYMKDHNINEYLTQKFLDTGIVRMISSKECSTDDITDSLCVWSENHSAFKMYDGSNDKEYSSGVLGIGATDKDFVYAKASDCFQPQVLSYILNDANFTYATNALQRTPAGRGVCQDLHKALESNNLTVGWKPWHRMVLFHSYGDEVVPYVNAQNALSAFNDSYYVKHVKFTDSKEANMRHVKVGTSFYFKLIGKSYEQEAINMLYSDYSTWSSYGTSY